MTSGDSHATSRRLAAILFTDIVGYTALMAESEALGMRAREQHRALVRPLVERHHGEPIEATGDESLSVFPSALDAVHCALAIEDAARGEAGLRLHIGIHVGDVVLRDGEVSGDGVNIASRICALSPEGGIRVSGEVYRSIRNQPDVATVALGEHTLKNVGQPVAVYAVGTPGTLALPPRRACKPIAILAGGMLVAAAIAGYFAFGRIPVTGGAAPLTSIAVLPFDDMSPDGDQKWLADGMAEELIETLSRVEAFRVIARTSTAARKGSDLDTIGAELRVGSVVEGSVRRSDDQLRVTAQLIRVSDGSHLWSARYDRSLADVFAVQTEIARAIAEAIRGELGIEYEVSWFENVHEASDVRAYELWRKGWAAMYPLLTEDGLREGIESFERALAIDPDYAQARVELGFAYLFRWEFHDRDESNLARARAEAERALASDATNGGAHNLLGWVFHRQYEWEEARRVVSRGLAHNPIHSALRSQWGHLLAEQGRTVDALVEARRAADIDPRFLHFVAGVGVVAIYAGDYAAAVEPLERAWELSPGYPPTRSWLAYAYHLNGRDEEALAAALRDLPPDLSGMEAAVRQAFADSGFSGAMRARHEWLAERKGTQCIDEPGWHGDPLATLGEGDSVFECLGRAVDRRDWIYLDPNPVYDPYRADPRFAELRRRMNLPE